MILALDLGRTVGWAVGDKDRCHMSGSTVIEGDCLAAEYDQFKIMVNSLCAEDALENYRIKTIAYEKPAKHPSTCAAERFGGREAIILLAARRHGITDVRAVHPTTLKKHATGDGRAPKQAMVDAANALLGDKEIGLAQHDEADAVCVWGWCRDQAPGSGCSGASPPRASS